MQTIFCATLLACTAAASGQQLIVNGDAELGDLTGWSFEASDIPNGTSIFAAMMVNPNGFLPCEGDWFLSFDGGSTGAPANSMVVASMYQEHAIPGGTTALNVGVNVASDPSFGSCDPGRAVLTLFDGKGAPIAGGFDTDWVLVFTWVQIGQVVQLPPDAASFRLELFGRLDCGVFINTFYDSVSVVAVECLGDFDASGDVGTTDLLALLANWGDCPGCPMDFDSDGMVGTTDLLTLLANWGPC